MGDSKTNNAVTITSNAPGPRYVHTLRGMEMIPAGGSLETEASDEQRDAIEESWLDDDHTDPMFTVEARKPSAKPAAAKTPEVEKPLAEQSVTALRKLAKAESIDLGDASTPADMAAKITEARLSLDGKDHDALIRIASEEGVEGLAADADDDAIRTAIEAKRGASAT